MCGLQRTFLATQVRILDMPLSIGSATWSRCAGRDQIAEGLLLRVRLRPSPKARDPLCVKEAKLGI
jgi:hypothetical protein